MILAFTILSIIAALIGMYYMVQFAAATNTYDRTETVIAGSLLAVISILAFVASYAK